MLGTMGSRSTLTTPREISSSACASSGFDRDITQRSAKSAGLPERHATLGVGETGVVGSENDDETGNGDLGKYRRPRFVPNRCSRHAVR